MDCDAIRQADRFVHLVFQPDTEVAAVPDAAHRVRRARVAPRAVHPEPALDEELAAFFGWLCDRAGLRIDHYRHGVLRRRTGACLRSVRSSSPAEARAAGEQHADKADRMLDALMVGVTSFFRDPHVFESLGACLAAQDTGRAPRVLSVGCSNGSELYSCAMLLADLGRLPGARLLGLDCRPRAVRAARAGIYPGEACDELPDGARRHFVDAAGGGLRVRPELRAACRWMIGDAFEADLPGDNDVVLCRNLAIYLNTSAADRLWSRLHALVRPGGLLVVGKAERPPAPCFRRVGPCLFRRSGTTEP